MSVAAQSPVIKCQCGYCGHMLGFKSSLSGRKILCPLCGDPLVIPKKSEESSFKNFVLREAIEKIRFNAWDKAFAVTILEKNKLPEKQLYIGICDFMKANRKQADLSLAEHLEGKGLLSGRDRDAIRALLKGTVKNVEAKQAECPNCFAKVDASVRACRFCGQRMSDAAFITCPKCKLEQKKRKGAVVCVKCQANLSTGLTQVARKCPSCKQVVFGDPKTCPNCRATIKSSRQKHAEQKTEFEEAKKKLMMGGGAAAAALLLIVVAWGPIRTLFRTMSVGSAQASLETRLRNFGEDLQYNKQVSVKSYLSGKLKDLPEEDLFKVLCTGKENIPKVTSIRSVTPVEINMGENEKSAVVTAAVKITLQQDAAEQEARSVFAPAKTHTVEWAWQRGDGPWQLISAQ